MGPASKPGHVPHPPSTCGSSALQNQRRNKRHPQPFSHFLDFLTESHVLDSLETVVEKATERMAAMKTEAGVPLVEVQDPVEVPSGGRRAHARPSLSTVHRHRVRPTLCTGHPNNYPSSSSSMSDSHSSLMAGWLGSHSRDSDLGAQGLGSLPPVKDKLLLEKNLKRLLQLERKGKGLSQSCSKRDSLLWDLLGSQTSFQWTQEQPLSWFSELLGSSSGVPEASEPRPGEQEPICKREFNKEIKSLLSQLESLDLPGYCPLREPHRTLNFLADHRLFPALQSVVNQAVDKLRGARCRDGRPLFPTSLEPPSELQVQRNLPPLGSEPAEPTNSGQPHPTVSSPKMPQRKHKDRGGSPSMSSAQVATRFKLKSPRSSGRFTKKKPLPSISSKSSMSHFSNRLYEELADFLTQQAASLLIRKYEFEKDLSRQLSPLEPKLSVSAGTGMGSSLPKSKDTDSEGHDEAEVEDEDEDEYKDEDQDEDKEEDGVQSLPEPGEEASVSHSVDVGHSDPP
nr:hypothetical protein [Macaca fascicularis]